MKVCHQMLAEQRDQRRQHDDADELQHEVAASHPDDEQHDQQQVVQPAQLRVPIDGPFGQHGDTQDRRVAADRQQAHQGDALLRALGEQLGPRTYEGRADLGGHDHTAEALFQLLGVEPASTHGGVHDDRLAPVEAFENDEVVVLPVEDHRPVEALQSGHALDAVEIGVHAPAAQETRELPGAEPVPSSFDVVTDGGDLFMTSEVAQQRGAAAQTALGLRYLCDGGHPARL